ncbi:MAG: putative lipid II flippase FtsW [Candidatus Zixiibacteriota bacterium]
MIDRSRPDYILFLTALGLVAIGVVTIYSASAILALERFGSTTFFVKKQAIWGIITLLLILALTRVDYHHLEKISPFLLLGSFLLLVAVLFVPATRGASRWIRLGPLTFQPSELFRYALIFFMAFSLSKRKERIKELKFVLLPYFLILIIALGLIMKQPHLGAVLLISLVVFAMLFVGGARIRHLLLIVAPVILSVFILVFFLGYKKARVNDYLSSLENPLKGSYQMKQSVLALGSGEMVGVGLGEGKAKLFFLPEPHTDFIFATTGEELGFMGSAAILILFFLLAARGMSIARRAPDDFGYLLAFGITFSIFAGFLINAGVVVGLLPTTGLPMPFLSYGGSSLIFSALGIGILLNVSRQTKYVSSQRILRKMGI